MLSQLSKQLVTMRSRINSTSLVTFYVPPTTRMADFSKMVNLELSKTPNIKSKQTRDGVSTALQAVSSQIKRMQSVPANGVVIFAGETEEGFQNVAIEPPRPIDRFFYRCDTKFWV